MSDLLDEEIAARVQSGESDIFGELVRRYEERMTRYARRFLIRGEEVKDVVQEVFLKAYVNIRSFDATRKFSSWLYRIAHNEFINAIKKRERLPFFAFDLDEILPHLAAKETAHGEFEQKEVRRLLEAGLDKLSVKYREPLVLYYLEELDYKEIAEILRIPVATVGVRLNRGRALLKKQLTV